jgi:hypothetical protein
MAAASSASLEDLKNENVDLVSSPPLSSIYLLSLPAMIMCVYCVCHFVASL